jgi:hypothetical protein
MLLIALVAMFGVILLVNPAVAMFAAAGMCLLEHLRTRPGAMTDDAATPDDFDIRAAEATRAHRAANRAV